MSYMTSNWVVTLKIGQVKYSHSNSTKHQARTTRLGTEVDIGPTAAIKHLGQKVKVTGLSKPFWPIKSAGTYWCASRVSAILGHCMAFHGACNLSAFSSTRLFFIFSQYYFLIQSDLVRTRRVFLSHSPYRRICRCRSRLAGN